MGLAAILNSASTVQATAAVVAAVLYAPASDVVVVCGGAVSSDAGCGCGTSYMTKTVMVPSYVTENPTGNRYNDATRDSSTFLHGDEECSTY